MKRAIFLVCAGLFGLTISMPVFAGTREQKQTEQVDRNFPFQPGGQLTLKNFSGTVRITGSNRANVVIHAVRRATRERLDHIHLDIRATDSEIAIEANKRDDSWREHNDNVVETDFEIEVPQRTTLDVHGFSSEIHVESVEGRQKLYSFSGTIRVENASGPLNVETFSGEIEAELERESNSPEVQMKTFSGDIDVKLGASSRGESSSTASADRSTRACRCPTAAAVAGTFRARSAAAARMTPVQDLQRRRASALIARARTPEPLGPLPDTEPSVLGLLFGMRDRRWIALLILFWAAVTAACSRSAPRFSLDNARAHVEMLAGTIGSRPIGTSRKRARPPLYRRPAAALRFRRARAGNRRTAGGDRTHRARLEHHRHPFGNRARRDRPDVALRLRRRRAWRGRRWAGVAVTLETARVLRRAKRSTSHADGPRHRRRRSRPDGRRRADRGS